MYIYNTRYTKYFMHKYDIMLYVPCLCLFFFVTICSARKGRRQKNERGIWLIDVTQESHTLRELARDFSLKILLYKTTFDRTFLIFSSELLAPIVSTNFPYYLSWDVIHTIGTLLYISSINSAIVCCRSTFFLLLFYLHRYL